MHKLELTAEEIKEIIIWSSGVSLDEDKQEFVLNFNDAEIDIASDGDDPLPYDGMGVGELRIHSWKESSAQHSRMFINPLGCFLPIRPIGRIPIRSFDMVKFRPHEVIGMDFDFTDNRIQFHINFFAERRRDEYSIKYTFEDASMEFWFEHEMVRKGNQ